jgi:hypothetical protein
MKIGSTLGALSSLALLIPAIFILFFGLYKHRAFLALAIYYFLSGIYNLAQQGILPIPNNINYYFGIVNNLLDGPLMLIFLCWFSFSSVITKRIRWIIYFFLVFEAAMLAIFGVNITTIKIVLAPDIIIVLAFTSIFFFRQLKLTVTQQKGLGKSFMICAVLFAYTLFGLIYLFYYLLETPYKGDAMIVYHLASLFSAGIMSAGIRIEVNRIRKINELKHTRRELAALYGQKEKPYLRPIT